ncbi:hypothetical protein LEMLEM_LOCUS4133, partial [Lemmus lemmus]
MSHVCTRRKTGGSRCGTLSYFFSTMSACAPPSS